MFQKSGSIDTTYIEGKSIPSVRYKIFRDIDFVQDGFSTRMGGVSTGQFESLNFSVKMGDSETNVQENFRRFLEAHDFKDPVMTDQTHTTNVIRVGKSDSGKNIFCPKDYHDIDGFVTNERGVTLVTTFADCVPLYFVDAENHAIGMAHSGWKGTFGQIGRIVIEKMNQEFGTRADKIYTAIGPSICANCYEVSEELAIQFTEMLGVQKMAWKGKIPVQDMSTVVYCKEDRYYLNLWAANYHILKSAGVQESRIAIPDICTCCNSDKMFSHRASKGKRGNLCGFLMLT